MLNKVFSLLLLSPLAFVSPCFAQSAAQSSAQFPAGFTDMPVPFEPVNQNNAVNIEFLKLYADNPKNATIPADILAILQNQDSLEPPTIVHKADTTAIEDTLQHTFFPKSSSGKGTVTNPALAKTKSPNLAMVNEIAKDPKLLQSIPLDELNNLILASTSQTEQMTGQSAAPLLSLQKSGSSPASMPNMPTTNSAFTPALPNISNLQNFRLIAAKQQVTDANTGAKPNTKNTDNTELNQEEIQKVNNPQFSPVTNAFLELKLDELEEKVKQGDEEAPFTLAHAYFNGTAGQKDAKRAFALMEDLAIKGNTRAMVELGRMYEADGPNQNIMRAANYYQQAISKGDVSGKYHLGMLYYKEKFGQGDQALKHAIYAFREAAAKGHAPSMYQLATMYEKGAGFGKDMGQAVQLYRKSAHAGYAPAQLQVGLLYENGILVPKNETLAAAWYTKAAEQGLPTAQYLLAGMYRQGAGIPKNLAQAHILYENAAKAGLVDAQYDLGVFYLLKSEFQDYKKAEYWLQKAADQNDTQAREILLQVQQKLSKKKK